MESTFASRVKAFRKHKKLTQTAFAEQCGLEQGNITQMETGTEPKQGNVSKIIAGCPDLNPDWLLNGTGPMLRDGRELTPIAQLPPQVPSKLEPLTAPAGPGKQTPDELREQMRIVAESSELREVKSERDHLREVNQSLLAIIRNFSGGATDAPAAAGGSGKADASSYAADLRDTVDEIVEEYPLDYRIVAVKRIGFEPSHLRIA